MQPVLDLHLLVDKYAALLPKLNDEDKEEYNTMLRHLPKGAARTPNETFVDRCLTWLAWYNAQPQTNVA
jgi:hypothetical protein